MFPMCFAPLSDTFLFRCDRDRSRFWGFYSRSIKIFDLRNDDFLGIFLTIFFLNNGGQGEGGSGSPKL